MKEMLSHNGGITYWTSFGCIFTSNVRCVVKNVRTIAISITEREKKKKVDRENEKERERERESQREEE